MNRHGKAWTPAELKRLRDIYARLKTEDVAALMGRSFMAVETKASDLSLRKDARILARIRQDAQRRPVNPTHHLASLAPEKPRERPETAMRGVWYGGKPVQPGRTINGNRLARAVAWAT